MTNPNTDLHRAGVTARSQRPPMVPKLIGSDVELGNMIFGRTRAGGSGAEAAATLLAQIDGFPKGNGHVHTGGVEPHGAGSWSFQQRPHGASRYRSGESWGWPSSSASTVESGYDPQDWGRKYLSSNGGCVYVDLNHLELCTPEVLGAREFVAASRAMLWLARDAMHAANEQLPDGERLVVLANNSDGLGNSYGSHLNFLMTRVGWQKIFDRIDLFALASYQASSIVFTGQGKVGCENGRRPVGYQISQRADFVERLQGVQTTYLRPLVNARDEPLCGAFDSRVEPTASGHRLARLHCIFYDHTLCHVSTLLKVGVMQLVLAMIEAGETPDLLLRDPVAAVRGWSHDPQLCARARMATGADTVTAVELQRKFLARVDGWVNRCSSIDDIVPEATMILSLWDDTLTKLEAGDFDALTGRLDWVLKRSLLQRVLDERPELDWASPEIKHLDHAYANLDSNEGLYWACERSGVVERVVSDVEIERFVHQPPPTTRAWMRAMLLRLGGERVHDVNWDEVILNCSEPGQWLRTRTLSLGNPLGFTRAECRHHFADADSIGAALDGVRQPADGARLALVDTANEGNDDAADNRANRRRGK